MDVESALKDVPGVLDWTHRAFPRRPIHWVGHSMGGFATGLAHNNRLIARQLNVATLSGYWGRMAAPERYRVRLLMRFLAPPVVWAKGYFPGVLMGGEDLPGPAFLEWMGWCMEPEFLFGDDTLPERRHFPEFRAPIRFVQVADDPWGTPAAVGHMDIGTGRLAGETDRPVGQPSIMVIGPPFDVEVAGDRRGASPELSMTKAVSWIVVTVR